MLTFNFLRFMSNTKKEYAIFGMRWRKEVGLS